MIKFILRVFGIGRYKVFAEFSDTCWRRYRHGSFIRFSSACKMADKCATENHLLGCDYTVSLDRDGEELYRAKFKKFGNIHVNFENIKIKKRDFNKGVKSS